MKLLFLALCLLGASAGASSIEASPSCQGIFALSQKQELANAVDSRNYTGRQQLILFIRKLGFEIANRYVHSERRTQLDIGEFALIVTFYRPPGDYRLLDKADQIETGFIIGVDGTHIIVRTNRGIVAIGGRDHVTIVRKLIEIQSGKKNSVLPI